MKHAQKSPDAVATFGKSHFRAAPVNFANLMAGKYRFTHV